MKKFLALVLALVMTMSLVTIGASAKTDFTDDAKITNEEAVEVLNAMGVLTGYPDGSFRPQATLTRGSGAKIIAYLTLGQKDADALKATYTVFSDVTDTVGQAAYIEWAASQGIVDGYGDGTFGPYNLLTEYAFGKMLLVALGYDGAEEGFTGAGWQKNVYGIAVKNGVYDGTEAFGLCDRETAARMALGALLANVVVYGKGVVGGDYYWNGIKVNGIVGIGGIVDGVIETDRELYTFYDGLEYTENALDIFGRPGHGWEYKTTFSKFYMDAPVAEYTEAVTVCDVLVDGGIAKTSKASADVLYAVDGLLDFADKSGEYSHADCDETLGGQGTLTQVFEVADVEDNDKPNYIVTEIHTFLADVESAKDKTHKNDGESKINVWYVDDAEKATHKRYADVTIAANIGYEAKDYILVNFGFNTAGWDPADTTVYDEVTDGTYEADMVIVGAPTVISEGKYTGVAKDQSLATVNGVRENTAVMYELSEVTKLTYSSTAKYADFLVDQYGNLIGDVKPGADAYTYGVLADLVWVNDGGIKGDHYAEVLYYGADAAEDVFKMTKYTYDNDNKNMTPADADLSFGVPVDAQVSQKASANLYYYDESVINMTYLGVVKNYGDGKIVKVDSGVEDYDNETVAYGVDNVVFEKNNPNVENLDAKVDTDTQFLVKTLEAGEAVYTSYVGIDTLPTIKLATAVAVTEGTDKTAAFVYIDATNAIFDGSSVLAVILEKTPWYAEIETGTYIYKAWVNGQEIDVIATTKNLGDDADDLFKNYGLGIFKLAMNAEGKVIDVDRMGNTDGYLTDTTATDVTDDDTVVVLKKNDGKAYNIAGAKIYQVEYTGTDKAWDEACCVTVMDMTDIAAESKVIYKLASGSEYVIETMYVFVEVEPQGCTYEG